MFKFKTEPFSFKIKVFLFKKVIIIGYRFMNIFNTFITFRSKSTKNLKIGAEKIIYINNNQLEKKQIRLDAIIIYMGRFRDII